MNLPKMDLPKFNFVDKVKSMKKVHVLNTIIVALSCITVVLTLSFVQRIIISPSVDPYSANRVADEAIDGEKIQLTILNACGISGLAAEARDYLRNRGYDVVEIGNYPEVINNSIICDRTGNNDSANKIAFAMGIPDSLIVSDTDSTLFISASIIIGEDFHTLKPFN